MRRRRGDDGQPVLAVDRPPDRRPDELDGHEDPEDGLGDGKQRGEPGGGDRLVVPDDVVQDRGAHRLSPGRRRHPGRLGEAPTRDVRRHRAGPLEPELLGAAADPLPHPLVQVIVRSHGEDPDRDVDRHDDPAVRPGLVVRHAAVGLGLRPQRALLRRLGGPEAAVIPGRSGGCAQGLQGLGRRIASAACQARKRDERQEDTAASHGRGPIAAEGPCGSWSPDSRRGASRVAVPDPLALGGGALGLSVGLAGHVDVLGVDLGHHELAELDELLDLLGGDHVPGLDGLHPAHGAVAEGGQRVDSRLLDREVLAVEAHRVQRAPERVQRRAGPAVVLARPVGDGPVPGIPLAEQAIHVGQRVGEGLLLLDDPAEAEEPGQRLPVPDALRIVRRVLDQHPDLLDLVGDHGRLVDDGLDHLQGADRVLDEVGGIDHDLLRARPASRRRAAGRRRRALALARGERTCTADHVRVPPGGAGRPSPAR